MTNMIVTTGDHKAKAPGPAVAAYIDEIRGNQSARQFAAEHPGLDDARISAWRKGATPRLEHLRAVADALGASLGDVLVIAGLAREGELVVSAESDPPSIDKALSPGNAGDPTLSEELKAALRAVLDQIRDPETMGRTSVVVPARRSRR